MTGLLAGLNGLGSNPLWNTGLGLMSAAKPFGNVGDSLMQASQVTAQNQAAQQQLAMNRLNMQRTQAMMPLLNAYYQKAGSLMGGQQPSGPPPSAPSVGTQAPADAPAATPSMQIDPQSALQLGTIGSMIGAPGAEALTKYPEAVTNAQKAIQQQRQMQVQGPMALLDSVASSPNAHVLVQNIPGMQDQWAETAPKLGLDPNDPSTLTAANARAFATMKYNDLAGSAGLPPKPMPAPVIRQPRGNGDVRDIDPISGKDVGGSPAVATGKYVVNGQVVEMPTAQAVAKGYQPYDSALYGASQISPQSMEQAYQRSKATGDPKGELAGRDPIAAAQVSSYIAKRAQEDGATGLAQAAQAQAYKASQGVVNSFLSGDDSKKLTAINTTVAHSQTLLPLIDALGTGNLTKINQAKLAYQEATGKPAPTDYKVIANMYAGEASNAITANGGDKDEREAIKAPYSSIHSPTQLKSAVQLTAQALAGKTDALRNKWDIGTQGAQGSFDKLLLPETRAALAQRGTGGAAPQHPPNIQKLLDKYNAGPK